MLTPAKKTKLASAVKAYSKKYLGNITELDESGTRLMINSFLSDVLGYEPISEIKTEYMIKGTYADYVLQVKGQRHFLVEVKSLSLQLSEKHLRQTVNYGANEGIEWALLTNGRNFDLYKILFNKPIESVKIFSFNLSDPLHQKNCTELLQFLHRDSVVSGGLSALWDKTCALNASHIAGLLYSPAIMNCIKKELKARFKAKFSEEDISGAITRLITTAVNIETVKPYKARKERKPKVKTEPAPMLNVESTTNI